VLTVLNRFITAAVTKAISKGILNTVDGTYLDLRSGTKMLMGDAVDKELVEVEFDMNAEGK